MNNELVGRPVGLGWEDGWGNVRASGPNLSGWVGGAVGGEMCEQLGYVCEQYSVVEFEGKFLAFGPKSKPCLRPGSIPSHSPEVNAYCIKQNPVLAR